MRLLGENSAKVVNSACKCCAGAKDDELGAELRRLWEMARLSLPDKAVTYEVGNDLGVSKLVLKGQHEEGKEIMLAALEGRRRVLGEEHRDTLASLNNLGAEHGLLKEYEGALGYY